MITIELIKMALLIISLLILKWISDKQEKKLNFIDERVKELENPKPFSGYSKITSSKDFMEPTFADKVKAEEKRIRKTRSDKGVKRV